MGITNRGRWKFSTTEKEHTTGRIKHFVKISTYNSESSTPIFLSLSAYDSSCGYIAENEDFVNIKLLDRLKEVLNLPDGWVDYVKEHIGREYEINNT